MLRCCIPLRLSVSLENILLCQFCLGVAAENWMIKQKAAHISYCCDNDGSIVYCIVAFFCQHDNS